MDGNSPIPSPLHLNLPLPATGFFRLGAHRHQGNRVQRWCDSVTVDLCFLLSSFLSLARCLHTRTTQHTLRTRGFHLHGATSAAIGIVTSNSHSPRATIQKGLTPAPYTERASSHPTSSIARISLSTSRTMESDSGSGIGQNGHSHGTSIVSGSRIRNLIRLACFCSLNALQSPRTCPKRTLRL